MTTSDPIHIANDKFERSALLVLGMHRSGTSALTRALSFTGFDLAVDDIGGKLGNESGHWESKSVIELNDDILSSYQSDWTNWRKIKFSAMNAANDQEFTRQISRTLDLTYPGTSDFVVKDPRISLLAPLYIKSLRQLKCRVDVVISIRNPLEVCASLAKRNQIPLAHASLLWLRYNLEAERTTRHARRNFVEYDALLTDWHDVLRTVFGPKELKARLSGSKNSEHIEASLTQDLRHHQFGLSDVHDSILLRDWVFPTFSALKQLTQNPYDKEAMARLDYVAESFDAAEPFLNQFSNRDADQMVRRIGELDAENKELEKQKTSTLDKIQKLYSEREADFDRAQSLRFEIESEKGARATSDLRAKVSGEKLSNALRVKESLSTDLDWHVQKLAETYTALKTNEDEVKKLGRQWQSSEQKLAGALSKIGDLTFEVQRETEEKEGLEKTIVEAKSWASQLEGNVKDLKMSARVLRGQVTRARNKTIKLQAEHDHAAQIAADLSKTLEKTEQDKAQAERERRDAEKEKQEADKRWQVAEQARQEAEQAKEAAETYQRLADVEIINLKTNNANITAALAEAQSNYSTILNSTSWRVTATLRRAKLFLSNIIEKNAFVFSGRIASKKLERISTFDKAHQLSNSESLEQTPRQLAIEREQMQGTAFHLRVASGKALPDDQLPSISISMVLYNSAKWLPNFLTSLRAVDYPAHKISLFFVDNGSKDETNDLVKNFLKVSGHNYKAVSHFNRPNLGYGSGNDFAIRKSSDDFVLVTNVDTQFDKSSLAFAVSAALRDDSKTASWEFRQLPYEHPKYYDPTTLCTNWSAHACVLLNRAAYLKVGGYEKRIFMYGEDVELSYNFRAHGYRLRYLPGATITHFVDFDATDVRAEQLSGSIAANVLMRYKYGRYRDVLGGEALFRWVRYRETDDHRKAELEKTRAIINKNRLHFYKSRKKPRTGFFPFREFDYDLVRDGADVKTPQWDAAAPKPLVTIITRTYGDRASHLQNAILSVLNQTYPNIEHIIVEDRTSMAESVVRSFMTRYGEANIRYIKSEGEGRSAAGNLGLKEANGEYICFLDDDDFFFSAHIETLVQRLVTAGKPCVAAYGLAWNALSHMNEGVPTERMHLLPAGHKQPYSKARLMNENFIPIQAILFSRELYEKYGGFHEELSALEDWNLWVRYAQGGDFIYVPKVTSVYRTPWDLTEQNQRQKQLDAAYDGVSAKNIADISKFANLERHED